MNKKIIFSLVVTICMITTTKAQHLYKATPDGRVDSVWAGINLPQGFTGEGVIIGVTDWGFDYTHPVFYDSLMTHYRILRAWDQFKTSGPAPAGFNYGTEYVGQTALLEAGCDTSNIYGYHYHATHVASIAGGAGAGTKYKGVAPETEFLFATFLVDEQAVMDAWDWMYEISQNEGKRLVINMSWGLQYMDNLTGNGILAQKMQELSNQGVVFVTSAGNNGDTPFHLEHTFQGDTIHSEFAFNGGAAHYWGQSISMTNSEEKPFAFSFSVYDSQYHLLGTSPFYNTADGDNYIDTYLIVNENDSISYNVEIDEQDAYNQRPEIRFRVEQKSIYHFALNVVAEAGTFHAWNVAELTTGVGNWGADFLTPSAFPEWLAGDQYYGVSAPATAECAISVAAHVSQSVTNNGNTIGGYIANFSSYGTTIDGRQKPDISAPGFEVCAAKSSFTDQPLMSLSPVDFNGKTYKFCKLSGTSMSSPFVTGVVALLLQANPTLTPEQVKEILLRTARHDNFTESTGTIRFGRGKVDAYHAVMDALGIDGLAEINSNANQYTIFPNPANDVIYISSINNEELTIAELFDMTGKLFLQINLKQGVNQLNIKNYQSGIYILKISNDKFCKMEKIVITR